MSALPHTIAAPKPGATASASWRVEIAGDDMALERVRSEWEKLWLEDPQADVFGSYDWFANWWQHFGRRTSEAALVAHGAEGVFAVPGMLDAPAVCIVRDGAGRVAALLPLVRASGTYCGCRARILATPVNSHAPRTALLVARDAAEDVLQALARHLAQRERWDVLLIDGLGDAGERWHALVRALRAAGLRAGLQGSWSHASLRFDGSWEQLLADKGGHFRKHLGQSTRALEKLGELTVERHVGADAAAVGLPLFLAIDAASWKASEGETIEGHAHLREYYTQLCRRLAALGRCEIWVMRIGGAPAAAFVCLTAKRTCHTLKTSFDAAYTSSRRSPSHVLLGRMIRESWDGGIDGMDFVGRLAFVDRWANGETTYGYASFHRNRWLPLRIDLRRRARGAAGLVRRGVARLRKAARC